MEDKEVNNNPVPTRLGALKYICLYTGKLHVPSFDYLIIPKKKKLFPRKQFSE